MPRKPKPPEPPPKPKRRRRGQGSVRQRQDGLWEARMPAHLGRRSTYHETAQQAEAWLRAQLNPPEIAPGSDELLGNYLTRWYDRSTPRWARSRAAAARQFLGSARPLWQIRLCDLRSDRVADWAADLLRAKLAPATVAYKLAFLKSALEEIVPDVLQSNPAGRRIRLPKPASKGPAHFEKAQARRFLRLAAGTPAEVYFQLLLGTGIREGEALGLRWDDVDLDGGLAKIRSTWDTTGRTLGGTKTRTVRDVELVQELRDALRSLPGEHKGWVFPSPLTDRPLTNTWARRWFQTILERSGVDGQPLPNIKVHGLRHTFASISLDAGVPLATVSVTLGHANTGVTSRTYSHALKTRSGAAERALSEALGWLSADNSDDLG